MILSKGLLIKGAASLGVAGVAVGGYVGRDRIGGFFSSLMERNSLLRKAGISCNEESGCALWSNKTIVIRQGDASTDKEVNTLSSTTSKGAKIVLQKLEGKSGYNENLKFTVVGGDITLGKESPITMEETETYELREEGGKYVLSRKNASLLKESGLKCEGQNACVLEGNKKITIRQESISKEVSSLSPAASTKGKIILQRVLSRGGIKGYNAGLKFSIEGEDITLGVSPSQVLLEQTETYELIEENGKFILSRKNKSIYRGELKIPKTCPESDKSSKQVECKIMAAGPKNADSIRVKAKGITPPSEVQGLMNKWGITLPKDLRDLGMETPRTKVRWTLDPTKKNSSLYPKITKEELKVPEHLKVRRST